MSAIFQSPLHELKSYEDLVEALKKRKGPLQAAGCMDSQKVHLLAEVGNETKETLPWQLIITYSEQRVREIEEDYRLFCPQVCSYPAKDFIFYSADIQGKALEQKRLRTLKQMSEQQGGVVVTTIGGLMNLVPPFQALLDRRLILEEGMELSPKKLRRELTELGYEQVAQVEGPGQYSVRGGILDLFSLTEEAPWRIEFWGDEIDSIRSFETESQRSIERVEVVEIFPAAELVFDEKGKQAAIRRIRAEYQENYETFRKAMKTEEAFRLKEATEGLLEELESGIHSASLESFLSYFYPKAGSFLDYFPKGKTLICLDEPVRLKEQADAVEAEFRESMSHRLEKGYLLPGQTKVLQSVSAVFSALHTAETLALTGLDQNLPMLSGAERVEFSVRNADAYKNSFEMLIKDLQMYRKEGWRVVLLCPSRTRAERMAKDLEEYDLRAWFSETGGELIPGTIQVARGSLHRGFCYPQIRFAVICESDIFGEQKKKKRRKSAYQGQKISSYTDLSVGDYVVHETHGIGIYRGIEKMEMDKMTRDYMKIEYGDGGKLYIPATQFHLIQKYADADAKQPKLNRLGTPEWKKTKSRVQSAVQDIAKELVELYSARQNGTGYAFGQDTVWQKEFEEMFPYEETEDQLSAIEATKTDMESAKIMDRLVCGDVGFGKTEIAIRAAFKAVQEGKQVAYLVPTTILAQQHYNTFVQRMKDFPVRIDLLSRFRTPAQVKNTLEDLKKGFVDIVIGTHRILSKDVQFKDLGLLIIDEEQRFGVTHKEKIKQMKKNVDVLTLTATPIPRTLHMSLIGIRDMSTLEEPPADRLPIQTYVMEWNPEVVREAINRELARGGQVFYVYNRVKDIAEMTLKIQELVPDANVAFAHGQMSEREMERIMMDFINGDIDVLVSTTIIETGLDISNVNTILIHDSDRYGLSQLYQLRGRVGRSNRTAYAFILYKHNKVLKEDAQKRLEAIREFTELGSGLRIAMRDLEIRGAGNLLGAKQHGHMEAVGYDLYCKMLNEAVQTLKGEPVQLEDFETTVDFAADAYIPSSYIRNEYQKLDMYRRISGVASEDERLDLQDELLDRYGEPPKAVENLLSIALIRAMAHEVYVTDLTCRDDVMTMKLYPKAPLDGSRIPELLTRYRNQLKILAGEEPELTFRFRSGEQSDWETTWKTVKKLLIDIKILLVP